jgi:predicted flap endonuclease-1-like 5' DNA nuclease
MHHRFQAQRNAMRADQNEARQVWQNFNMLEMQRRLKKGFARPLVIKPPVEAAPIPKQPSHTADDLTVIRGIGPGMAQRLHQAGIYTFAQLAAITPDELRRALGNVGRLAKVETWITQARDLAL